MTRVIAATLFVGLAAACTGPGRSQSSERPTSTRHFPEPTTPGVHVSGYLRVGVSTVK